MSTSISDKGGRYGAVAIALHWAIALGILTLIAMGLTMDHLTLDPMRLFQLYQLHKSIGITVMFLIVARIGWRLANKPPELPDTMHLSERRAASVTHVVLYGLQIVLPLSGWAMVSASVLGIPTVLYGTIPWPDLPVLPTLSNKAAAEGLLKVIHHWASWILLAFIGVHAAAAVRHHVILRDAVLWRMLPILRVRHAAKGRK